MLRGNAHGQNSMNLDRNYLLLDGDGDQSLLGQQHRLRYLQVVSEKVRIFPDRPLVEKRFYLFSVLDGEFEGKILALSSRVLTDVGESLETNGFASVVVFLYPE